MNLFNRGAKVTPYVLYLAVLPKYRTQCIRLLRQRFGKDLACYASSAHLDKSVRTGVPSDMYNLVPMRRLLGNRAFIQFEGWRAVLTAKTAVLDLNPRSVSAWLLLLLRWSARRRTLLWGHIHPQAGPNSRTAILRRAMRRISNGTISYTYRDADKALRDIPGSRVWVAPNSLYRANSIRPVVGLDGQSRDSAIYVGRFAPPKKVPLLIEAFALAVQKQPQMRLILIGGGEEEARSRNLSARLGVVDKVEFAGWIDDLDDLLPYYARSFCSLSPGFAGLGLTQSLGFGIPMLVADNEPHSPEIELDSSGGVHYFASESATSLAEALLGMWEVRESLPDAHLSEYTRLRYSAEAMASGLANALENRVSSSREGWTQA